MSPGVVKVVSEVVNEVPSQVVNKGMSQDVNKLGSFHIPGRYTCATEHCFYTLVGATEFGDRQGIRLGRVVVDDGRPDLG